MISMNQLPDWLPNRSSSRIDVPAEEPPYRVLVVDDERVNREILSRMLSRLGHEVRTALNGSDAIQKLETELPDLVLLDVIMDGLDGFETLKQIRAKFPQAELPVIMVTAESERTNVVQAFEQGANDYLTKPLDAQITIARVSLQLRLHRAQIELKRSQERYALAAQGSRIGLWDWDVARRQIFLSSRWKEMLGYQNNELESTIDSWFERIHPDDRDPFALLLSSRLTLEQQRFETEIRMLHRDGTFRWMLCSGVLQIDASGNPYRMAGSLADVTDAKVRDILTGLPNRLLFEEQLSKVLRLDPATHGHCAVLFLDLDNFKLVNDTLGHDAGDLLLCHVARKLASSLRTSDIVARHQSRWCVARHGGDEFTVLLQNLHSERDAEFIAERIISILSEPITIGANDVSDGVSISIAFGSPIEKNVADAIREADTAMYYAKTSGRGQFRTFTPEMQTEASLRLQLECDLRMAIKSNQFHLEYQPVIRMSNGQVEGFEALCRWNHPRGTLVGPDEFVPVLEALGLIGKLGQNIMEIAARDLVHWDQQGQIPKSWNVTVNCSSGEFRHPQFKNDLLMLISQTGVDPARLSIEVTESTLMQNPESVQIIMSELRELGVRIGIDDFGTGYSSLAYLHRLPLDVLKIDKSFVRDMMNCPETREIVRTIIALGQNLDLDIVAEGVESQAQLDLLFQLGCTHAQGYFYARPMLPQEVAAFVRQYQPKPASQWSLRTNDQINAQLDHAARLLDQN